MFQCFEYELKHKLLQLNNNQKQTNSINLGVTLSMAKIDLHNITDIQTRILDELSDGQWYPLYKITKKIERGSEKAKVFKQKLAKELELLVNHQILISGGEDSYRFDGKQLEGWRKVSQNPKIHTKQYQPRYFGGILEDEGWLLADLKTQDLVHFRAEPDLTREKIHKLIGGKLSRIQIDEGLYRVFSTNGDKVFNTLKDFKENDGKSFEIRGMRLEKNLRRRELDDLPPQFVNDLSKYYGQFAKVLLRGYMSSVTKHISDPDDIQQQIYIWVLDAIQRYDAKTSIPFAAYLSASLAKWVFNLNRKAYGRAVADAELKHSRMVNDFKLEHGRDPKVEELAELLQEDVRTVKGDLIVINTVLNLRNISSINRDEEHELPLPADINVEDNLDKLVNNMLLSAAITTAAKEEFKETKNLVGLIGLYYQTWGSDTPNKKVKSWVKNSSTQEAVKNIMVKAKNILEEERK